MVGKYGTRVLQVSAFMLCFSFQRCWADFILQGVVKTAIEKNPVAGVNVTAFGANGKPTDENGKFQLIFGGKRAGDDIALTVTKKAGWKVLDERVLYRRIPYEKVEEIEISLCKIADCDRLVAALHRINVYKIVEEDFAERINNAKTRKNVVASEINTLRKTISVDAELVKNLTMELENAKKIFTLMQERNQA